jgi:hypothetical protein
MPAIEMKINNRHDIGFICLMQTKSMWKGEEHGKGNWWKNVDDGK